jgi:hypothetical protein
MPFHKISLLVPSTALDKQHFLKPFTVTSGEMCYHVITIHTDYILQFYFLFYKLTWTHEDSQFSPQIVLRI